MSCAVTVGTSLSLTMGASVDAVPPRPDRLLLVALDLRDRTHLGLARVIPRLSQGSPLAQQVPAPVERLLHRAQPLAPLLRRQPHALQARVQRVLLVDQVLYPPHDVLVAHSPMVPTGSGGRPEPAAGDSAAGSAQAVSAARSAQGGGVQRHQ